MGYNKREIPRGTYGEFDKIEEEFYEALDGMEQRNPVLVLVELSDLIGAIEGYVNAHFSLSLDDIIKMKEATHRAFWDGTRQPRSERVV